MGNYLKPWRRKIGVVTLAMACVFAGGWVRSLTIYDCAIFYCGLHTKHTMFSERHVIGYQYSYERLPQHHPTLLSTNWGSNTPSDDLSDLIADTRLTWYWRCCGFGSCEYLDFTLNGCRCRIWIIPYWSVVLPLTLLSTWLLLSKPRATKPAALTPTK